MDFDDVTFGILITFFLCWTFMDDEKLYYADQHYKMASELCENNDGVYYMNADFSVFHFTSYVSEVKCNDGALFDTTDQSLSLNKNEKQRSSK